jgi:hypothetical protein
MGKSASSRCCLEQLDDGVEQEQGVGWGMGGF